MMMMMWLFIVGYIACWIGSAGLTFAYFQSEFPYIADEMRTRDHYLSILLGFGGPISLVTVFILSGCAKHGWRLR